nr:alpha-N-acetylgalactosaminidase isoform X3 [Vicugna pacos]
MLLKTVLLLALVAQVLMLDNGLLRTPPMGWLAWERFRCNIDCNEDPKNCISEWLFMEMADRLAQDGWRDLGYVYLNIDDCWIGGRDAKGNLVPDPKRFPNGIAFLADYVHSLGLKLGIYEDMGSFTCMGYPGTTLDKVIQDAQTFAEWKVDMLKLDGCFSTPEERAKGYPKMAAALNATGRPIAFSCSWPAYEGGLPPKVNYSLLANTCNLWRNYNDIQDSWRSVLSILDWFVKHQDILQPVAGPGHWNDPDMVPAWRGMAQGPLRPAHSLPTALCCLPECSKSAAHWELWPQLRAGPGPDGPVDGAGGPPLHVHRPAYHLRSEHGHSAESTHDQNQPGSLRHPGTQDSQGEIPH